MSKLDYALALLKSLVDDTQRDWCLVCGRDTEGAAHELGHDPDCSWKKAADLVRTTDPPSGSEVKE